MNPSAQKIITITNKRELHYAYERNVTLFTF